MNIFDYSIKNTTEIASELGVDLQKGLDKKSVAERRAKFGPNKLVLKETTGWHIFLRQFKSAFVYLLLAAMAITIFLGEWIDTLMIFIFIATNVGLGFYQEYSSEKTAKLLNKYALPRAKVLRGGKIEQITADQLVPGDIVVLKTGDKVPADLRLIEQDNLAIDETILTGESVPVLKKTERLKSKPSSYHQALNLAFSGTDVLKGEARGLVVATGKSTVFGQIAKLTSETKRVSDFEKGISRFSQFILRLVGVTLLVVFVARLLINRSGVGIFELLVFSVALAVSVIPEALPVVTTFSLACGAKRLAKRKVIVKRLSSIQDLGGIEILCSDKTGTLTENKLTIANIYSGDKEQTIWLANLASSFELKQRIEPFDIALEKGLNPEQKIRIKKATKISEEPFNPRTRRNSVLVRDGDKTFLIIRGAPEVIIPFCPELNKKDIDNINDWIRKEGRLGHRVLALGYKEVNIADKDSDLYTKELLKNDFIFSGIISFVDPIKKSAFLAVKQAKILGVKIVIITGDRPEVAGAVAHKIGLIDSPDKVITGEKWQKANEEKRREYLENYFCVCPDLA